MNFGSFGFSYNGINESALSDMILGLKQKQVSSDVTALTLQFKDPKMVEKIRIRSPIFEELDKVDSKESTYRFVYDETDTFGKFVTEGTEVSDFAAQKGTYTDKTVTTKILSYVLKIGLFAQKNSASFTDLVRLEQAKATLGIRKAVERCAILGDVAGGQSDGGPKDARAFNGLEKLITTNVDDPATAEDIRLEKLDAQIDATRNLGVMPQDQIIITDTFTKTKLAALFYDTFRTPIDQGKSEAGFEVEKYRGIPIFDSTYMPTTSGQRELILVDKNTTKLAEFYPLSQLTLGRTEVSDDSVVFWRGALAVQDEEKNAIIKKIL